VPDTSRFMSATQTDKAVNKEASVTGQEKRVFAVICTLFVLAITLPYLWVWTTTPAGFVYGGLLYNPDDQNVHLAWMRQAHDGAFFFRDNFTGESLDARPLFTNGFAWILGTLSRISTLPLLFWYHSARVVFAVLTLWWLLRLVAFWTANSRVRILTVALAAFSSGAGWLAALAPTRTFIDRADGATPSSPILMMPEAWTFASALVFPLFMVAMSLLPLVLWQTTRAVRGGSPRPVLWAALALAALTNIHTYDALPLGLLLWSWTAFNHRDKALSALQRWSPFLVSLGALPPLLFQVWVFSNSAEFQQKALTPTLAPSIVNLMFSFAPLLLLAVVGLWAARTRKTGELLWPALLWLAAIGLCIYAPVSFARKMMEGAHLPLCFLAAVGLAALLKNLSGRALHGAAVLAVAVLSISSLHFLTWCVANAADNNLSRASIFMPPLSLAEGDYGALNLLDESGEGRDGVVLALPYLSNYVPRETGRTVYAGHWAETLNYWDARTRSGKLVEAQKFYGLGRALNEADAKAFLLKNKIRFVIVGRYEQALMSQAGSRLPLTLPVWNRSGSTVVYSVPERF